MFVQVSRSGFVSKGLKKIESDLQIYFKGYIIWENQLYWDDEFIPILKKHIKEKKLDHYIKQYSGIFYFIVIEKSRIKIGIDRYGFLPLMYKKHDKGILIANYSGIFIENEITWNNNALIEYFSCGFSLDNKTVINHVYEFEPHRIYSINIDGEKLDFSEVNYWHFSLNLNKISKHEAKYKFKELIKNKFDIYSEYIRKKGNSILMPISGGLDSRFLLNEFDKREVESMLITFGGNKNNYDLKRGLELGFAAKNKLGHFIHVNTNKVLETIFSLNTPSNRITNAQPCELFFYSINKFKNDIPFFISGQSGGFITGNHMRLKMKKWSDKKDAINYIFKYKSSPFVKSLSLIHQEYLYNEITRIIPNNIELIDILYIWELTDRQRKYMTRYCLYEGDENNLKVFMPFYDYDLFDFFISLRFDELLNQKFFIRCMKDFIYSNNPDFINIKRLNKPIRNIHNHYLAEYFPKINDLIKAKLNIKTNKLSFVSNSFNWFNIIDENKTPNILKPYLSKELTLKQIWALIALQKIQGC